MAKRNDVKQAWILAILLALFLIGAPVWGWWRKGWEVSRIGWGAGAGAAVLLFAAVARSWWLRFFALWMKLAEAISWVMTRVILTVFYYLVLTPIGLVMRGLGKAPLDLTWGDGRKTYWIDKGSPPEPTLERYERLF